MQKQEKALWDFWLTGGKNAKGIKLFLKKCF
jgi:hypothetical protein